MSLHSILIGLALVASQPLATPDSAVASKKVEMWSGATWSREGDAAIAKLLSSWVRQDPEIRQQAVVELVDGARLRLDFEQGDPSPRVMRFRFLDVQSGWEAELEIDTLLLDQKEDGVPTVEQIVEAQRAGTISTKYVLVSSDGLRLEADDPREEPGAEQVRMSLEEIFSRAAESPVAERTSLPESAANGLRTLVALAEIGEKRSSPLEVWANSLRLFRSIFVGSEQRSGPFAADQIQLRTAVKPTLADLQATDVGRELRGLKLPSAGGS